MRAAVLAMLCAGVAAGQVSPAVSPADAQEREIVAKLLGSEKDSDKAWGAVLAAKYRQPRFVRDILELLNASNSRVRLAALDALIAFELDPPEEAMLRLLDAHPEHFGAVLILMARLPYLHRGFLESLLTRDLTPWHWVMLNAVLAQSPSITHTSHLWSQWTPTLEVAVIDPGGKPRFRGESTMCIDTVAFVDPDFPPVQFQGLFEPLGVTGAKLFVERGPHRLYLGADPSVAGGCFPPYSRQDYVRDFLEFLAGGGAARPDPALTWRDSAEYSAEASVLLATLREYMSDVRERLIERQLLSPDAPMWPKLEAAVSDQRQDRSAPLPAFDWTF